MLLYTRRYLTLWIPKCCWLLFFLLFFPLQNKILHLYGNSTIMDRSSKDNKIFCAGTQTLTVRNYRKNESWITLFSFFSFLSICTIFSKCCLVWLLVEKKWWLSILDNLLLGFSMFSSTCLIPSLCKQSLQFRQVQL